MVSLPSLSCKHCSCDNVYYFGGVVTAVAAVVVLVIGVKIILLILIMTLMCFLFLFCTVLFEKY